jgi:hypothetical protein
MLAISHRTTRGMNEWMVGSLLDVAIRITHTTRTHSTHLYTDNHLFPQLANESQLVLQYQQQSRCSQSMIPKLNEQMIK